jgi:hypothetical protein
VSSATEKAKRQRLADTVALFRKHAPTLAGRWEAITCGDFTQQWKALGGDDLPHSDDQRLDGGPVLRIHGDSVLATLRFVGTPRCHHMRRVARTHTAHSQREAVPA